MEIDVESGLRMLAAVVFGGLIGLNRDIYGKPTGIRAHALVSLGAAILMIAGSGIHIGGGHTDALRRIIQGLIAGSRLFGGRGIPPGGPRLSLYPPGTASSPFVTS